MPISPRCWTVPGSFGPAGVMRGMLTGAVIASAGGTVEALIATQAWAAPLGNAPLAVHLAIKTIIILAVILFGLVLGAWLFPTPGEIGLWLPFQGRDVAFSLAVSFVFNFGLPAPNTAEDEARKAHGFRRAIEADARERTPPAIRKVMEARNLKKYGDPLGPEFETLAKTKTPMKIIESAGKTNKVVNAMGKAAEAGGAVMDRVGQSTRTQPEVGWTRQTARRFRSGLPVVALDPAGDVAEMSSVEFVSDLQWRLFAFDRRVHGLRSKQYTAARGSGDAARSHRTRGSGLDGGSRCHIQSKGGGARKDIGRACCGFSVDNVLDAGADLNAGRGRTSDRDDLAAHLHVGL